MRCPVCGLKIRGDECRYCHTRLDDVYQSSNHAARALRRTDPKRARDEVVYTTYVPNDVKKTKLRVLTWTLGYVGANDFLVGRFLRGWFKLVSTVLIFASVIVLVIGEINALAFTDTFQTISEILAFPASFAFLMWVLDCFGVIFNRYKIPVVLGGSHE